MRQFRLFQQSSKANKLTARILEDGPAGIDLAAPLLVGHPLEFSPLLLAVVRSEERIGPEGLGAVLLQFVQRVELEEVVGVHDAAVLQRRRRFGRQLTSRGIIPRCEGG